MITEEQKKQLRADLPKDAISSRKQGGASLSYVQGWWVIGQLNEIFGPCGWSYSVETAEAVRVQSEDGEKGKRWHVTYRGRCVLKAGGCEIADVGHGHGIDKDCGAAIESAEKEAATDALKRCAKSLGWRLGLALYDKEQEHVVDTTVAAASMSETEEARVLRDWDAMSDADRRAAWNEMSAEGKSEINRRIAARKQQKKVA